jgi:hypothetical protein
MASRACLFSFVCLSISVILPGGEVQGQTRARPQDAPKAAAAPQAPSPTQTQSAPLLAAITLADIGFGNGFRLANLGARRDIFIPLPQGAEITAKELVLALDDISAHDARRSLEVLVNDRSVAAVALDGRSSGRSVRVPLGNTTPREGFLKVSFLYSGAATPDRCIDVRYVGDSLTVRPDSAVEIEIGLTGQPDVATTTALMPRNVVIALPSRLLEASQIATALTVARALAASGRQVTWHRGFDSLPTLARRNDERFWTHGLIIVGSLQETMPHLDAPVATMAGPVPAFGTLLAVRVGGLPALLVSDAGAQHAGRLLASPSLAATRGGTSAVVGDLSTPGVRASQLSFDRLGLVLPQADVFGRADLPITIDNRILPAGTKASRVILDVMVAPDGSGERAVVSAYVNERLVDSVVATTGAPTRLDFPLADGFVGATASIRALVQRRSAQGDCRFEPQGYPAQILGSSTVMLDKADGTAHDFSDLVPHWANGIEVLLPASAAEHPLPLIGAVGEVLDALTPPTASIVVKLVPHSSIPAPTSPFLVVSELPPKGSNPRVHFDRGRVAVADRSGKTLLDLTGLTGAVAQVVNVDTYPGLWIRPLASDGSLPAAAKIRLDQGDVAFIDKNGVSLAMSTERDTLVRVTYPDQTSWVTIADRFRVWIFGALWLLVTIAFLFALQRMLRRRSSRAGS